MKTQFMGKGRLEAFSDGVIAIIITIMVLEMKVPHGSDLASIKAINACLFLLCTKFYLHRYLLEQSPPHVANRTSC